MAEFDKNEFTIKCEIDGISEKIFPDNIRINEEISNLYLGETLIFIKNNNLQLEKLLEKTISFEISLHEKKRKFCGIITEIESIGKFKKQDIEYDSYKIKFSHPLFKLQLTNNSRCFQNKTPKQIISEIIKSNKLQIETKFNVIGEFANQSLEYCVQYDESDFDFISRIMEYYGLFYFFEYTESSKTLTKIVISNASNSYLKPSCENEIPLDYATNLTKSYPAKMLIFNEVRKFNNNKYITSSYDFESTNKNLIEKESNNQNQEYYEWNNYTKKNTGENIVKLRSKLNKNLSEDYYGESAYPFLSAGYYFKLSNHISNELNQEYVVTKISHTFKNIALNNGIVAEYRNSINCIKKSNTYIPDLKTKSPKIYGNILGIVTGPNNKTIYKDEFNRVKVHLFWDKNDSKKDENSSCWIRVAEFFSGSGFGSVFTPRIGTEVIVGFFNGDPNQPYVLGTLYNDKNRPPFNNSKDTITGIRTKSIDAKGFNEISFDDKGGEEKILIKAEKDFEENINHNKTITIEKGDFNINLKKGNSTLNIKDGNYEVIVSDNLIIKAKKVTIESSNDMKIKSGGNLDISASKAITMSSFGDTKISSKKGVDVSSVSTMSLKSNSSMQIKSLTSMKIKSSATMNIDAATFTLKTTMNMTLKSSLNAEIKSSVALTLKSSAINKVSGSIVMLG